jgi:hypothetical protein
MNKLKLAALLILILLGTSAGIVKIIKMPQELEFFQAIGLSEMSLVLFGAAQLIGGVLLVFQRSRLIGALMSAVTFSASAVMVFSTGAFGFGAVSLLPVLMSGWIIRSNIQRNSAALS